MSFLDNLPLGTIITLAGIVGGIIALANGSIDFQEFLLAIGVNSAGAGLIGQARNAAGKGIRK